MKSLPIIFALAAATLNIASAQSAPVQVLLASASSPSSSVSADLPATAIPAPCQVASDAAMVQETLRQFDTAVASHDVGQLQDAGVQPVSLKRWQKFFRDNPDATVTDHCPIASLFIMDDTAMWNCIETTTIGSGKNKLPMEHMMHFAFTKRNGAWTITERRSM